MRHIVIIFLLFLVTLIAKPKDAECSIKFVNNETSKFLLVNAPGYARLEWIISGDLSEVPQLWVIINNSTSKKSGMYLLNTIIPVVFGKASLMFQRTDWPFGNSVFKVDDFHIYAENAIDNKRAGNCYQYYNIQFTRCAVEFPNRPTTVVAGSKHLLTWITTPGIENVTVGVFNNNGKCIPGGDIWCFSIILPNTGFYVWDVPTNIILGNKYSLSVQAKSSNFNEDPCWNYLGPITVVGQQQIMY